MSLASENAVLRADMARLLGQNAQLRADLDRERTFTSRLLHRLHTVSERHWVGEHRGGDALRASESGKRDTTGFSGGEL